MSEIIKRFNAKVDEAFENLCTSIDQSSGLDGKTKELIRLASVVTDRSAFGVRIHTMRAIKAGASREEIIATVLNCLPVTGIESVTAALTNVMAAFENIGG